MKFEWDDKKNAANIKKHKIRFDHAMRVFDDPNHIECYDENHSDSEDRFIAVGFAGNQGLFVVFTEPDAETKHIISARKAKKYELEALWQ
jgi:uncharacterized DUF497 family protein